MASSIVDSGISRSAAKRSSSSPSSRGVGEFGWHSVSGPGRENVVNDSSSPRIRLETIVDEHQRVRKIPNTTVQPGCVVSCEGVQLFGEVLSSIDYLDFGGLDSSEAELQPMMRRSVPVTSSALATTSIRMLANTRPAIRTSMGNRQPGLPASSGSSFCGDPTMKSIRSPSGSVARHSLGRRGPVRRSDRRHATSRPRVARARVADTKFEPFHP